MPRKLVKARRVYLQDKDKFASVYEYIMAFSGDYMGSSCKLIGQYNVRIDDDHSSLDFGDDYRDKDLTVTLCSQPKELLFRYGHPFHYRPIAVDNVTVSWEEEILEDGKTRPILVIKLPTGKTIALKGEEFHLNTLAAELEGLNKFVVALRGVKDEVFQQYEEFLTKIRRTVTNKLVDCGDEILETITEDVDMIKTHIDQAFNKAEEETLEVLASSPQKSLEAHGGIKRKADSNSDPDSGRSVSILSDIESCKKPRS